jgi:molecular chaperone Hsp33
MSDILVNILSKNKMINGYFCVLSDSARKIQKSHKMNIISSAVFCRALSGAVLLSGNLKNSNDILTLKWNCTGPAKSIFVEVTGNGQVRGYIDDNNLQLIDESLNENQIKAGPYIGLGELIVSRIAFDGKEPYNSVVLIESGEIAEDLSIYMKQSLQIESALNIGLSISRENSIEVCGGLLLMGMPGIKDEDIKKIYSSFSAISSFTDLLKTNNADINIISAMLNDLDMDIISIKNIEFSCHCSSDKIIKYLKTLTSEQFTDFITSEGKIDAECQYCGMLYSFLPQEISSIPEN